MGKLMRMSPAVLLLLTACGSRGTHDNDDAPVIVTPSPECAGDDDCGDGAICFEGTCAQLAETDDPDTTPPPATTGYETAPTATTSTDTTSPPEPDVASLSGIWVGYLEGSNFPSGSDVVRLEVNAGDCTPTATLTLGEGDPLPPMTDPAVGYPEGIELQFPWDVWYEGHPYTANHVEVADLRLQLSVNYGQVWTEWCALQEPVQRSDGGYSCVDANGWTSNGEECTILTPEGAVVHDCGHLTLCVYGTCSCDSSSCQASTVGGTGLDVALDDGHLEGTLTGFGPVRLYRQE